MEVTLIKSSQVQTLEKRVFQEAQPALLRGSDLRLTVLHSLFHPDLQW